MNIFDDPFVSPNQTTIPLGDRHFIVVKNELTYGERERLNGAFMSSARGSSGADMEVGVNYERWAVERIFIWLVAWSFVDKEKRPVELTREAIRALSPAAAKAITDAIVKHEKEQDELKKATTPGKAGAEAK